MRSASKLATIAARRVLLRAALESTAHATYKQATVAALTAALPAPNIAVRWQAFASAGATTRISTSFPACLAAFVSARRSAALAAIEAARTAARRRTTPAGLPVRTPGAAIIDLYGASRFRVDSPAGGLIMAQARVHAG